MHYRDGTLSRLLCLRLGTRLGLSTLLPKYGLGYNEKPFDPPTKLQQGVSLDDPLISRYHTCTENDPS